MLETDLIGLDILWKSKSGDPYDQFSITVLALVKKGAAALRGMAETRIDGLADSALTALGAPELAPIADKLIDSGAKKLETRRVEYLDQRIDQSGKGARYMAATSGGCASTAMGIQCQRPFKASRKSARSNRFHTAVETDAWPVR